MEATIEQDETKIECPKCSGSGQMHVICKRCKGTGWVKGIPGGEICCGGWDEDTCTMCNGTGYLEDN